MAARRAEARGGSETGPTQSHLVPDTAARRASGCGLRACGTALTGGLARPGQLQQAGQGRAARGVRGQRAPQQGQCRRAKLAPRAARRRPAHLHPRAPRRVTRVRRARALPRQLFGHTAQVVRTRQWTPKDNKRNCSPTTTKFPPVGACAATRNFGTITLGSANTPTARIPKRRTATRSGRHGDGAATLIGVLTAGQHGEQHEPGCPQVGGRRPVGSLGRP